jgi:hypothetical protein
MFTLRGVLQTMGYNYKSAFTDRAEDIYFQSINDLCFSLGYILKHIKRIDAEIPEEQIAELLRVIPNYPIKKGITSGGNAMKWASQYRIYFNSIVNIPNALKDRLQNDTMMRMTGSKFIESCFFIGFLPGSNQDIFLICTSILKLFNSGELFYFVCGYLS